MANQNTFWSFKNYSDWRKQYRKCTGTSKNQSPIDIKRDKVEECSSMCRLKLDYKNSKCNVVTHNEVITIRYDSGSFARFNDTLYELIEAKIHIPSMHLIDGDQYDMEVDLYHCDATSETMVGKGGSVSTTCPNGGLIIGIFVQSGLEFGKSAEFFNQFINKVPIPETLVNEPIERSIPVSKTWTINDILPETKSFYTYKGSRPYPPCDEDWTWIVFQDYVTIGSTNYETLKYNLSDNIRPILPIYDRIVYHYNEPTLEMANNEDDNKDENTQTPGTLQLLETKKNHEWFERNREFIKQLLYTVIIIALILLALRAVVVVLRTGLFQGWVQSQLAKKQQMNSGGNAGMNPGTNPAMNLNQGANLNQGGMNPNMNPGTNPAMTQPTNQGQM